MMNACVHPLTEEDRCYSADSGAEVVGEEFQKDCFEKSKRSRKRLSKCELDDQEVTE